MKKLIAYFFEGLLIVFPLAATAYIVYHATAWFNNLLDVGIPGLGIAVVLASITLIGYLFSHFIGETVISFFDKLISRIPIIKLIYMPLKDMIEALVGDKKKFTEPVAVDITPDGIQMLGFVTRDDLTLLGVASKVAVYFPFSYTFTGHLLLVPTEKVKPLETNASEMMKFMVSGGVSGFDEIR
ncbi:MAG: DUF502 domain-containing protein [Bacteroidota bacterium]|nr:DUF502 domain-containing protein [Bacteroidota bacterium]